MRWRAALTLTLLAVVFGLSVTGCGPRRLNVMRTPQRTLLTVGYSADRSQSVFRANNEAQEYCRREEKDVVFLKEDTVYQGRYPEDVTQTARTAARVADALGSPKAGNATRSLSSPTDYKTSLEFQCD
ncbi:MAG TPA: hypothetical protein VFY29_05975 [Terriglobia bacterium]|nr:hypothetical protein [Terriglobia bacterium]